jgi:hypothetical protein
MKMMWTPRAEGIIAPGDSGSPTFIKWKIAGVHSFRVRYCLFDMDYRQNSTFGELGGDARVALVADWIDQTAVPLPGTVYLLNSGLPGLLLLGRRQRPG